MAPGHTFAHQDLAGHRHGRTALPHAYCRRLLAGTFDVYRAALNGLFGLCPQPWSPPKILRSARGAPELARPGLGTGAAGCLKGDNNSL